LKGRSPHMSQISDPRALVESSAVTAQGQAVLSQSESESCSQCSGGGLFTYKKTTVASRKTLLSLFNIMPLGKLTQRSEHFTSRHDARGTEISINDAEEVQNEYC